ncbi:hypothetical protein [Cryptosporangium minutisporangium]
MTRKAIDGWQGLCFFLGITLGVIPLIQFALGTRRGGLLRFVFGDDPGAARWIVPLVILAVAIAAITLLERRKART